MTSFRNIYIIRLQLKIQIPTKVLGNTTDGNRPLSPNGLNKSLFSNSIYSRNIFHFLHLILGFDFFFFYAHSGCGKAILRGARFLVGRKADFRPRGINVWLAVGAVL